MVYVGQTRSAKLVRRLWELGIGECTARGELPHSSSPVGVRRTWTCFCAR